MREYEIVAGTNPQTPAYARAAESDRREMENFDQWFRGSVGALATRSGELQRAGRLTAAGISDAIKPEIDKLRPGVERFEQATAQRLEALTTAKARIERGELVR